MFTSAENEFFPTDQDRVIIGGGDNCKIGNRFKNPSRKCQYRDNPDTETNSHGRFLADICNSFVCFPLNNLTFKGKMFDGKFTYYKGN